MRIPEDETNLSANSAFTMLLAQNWENVRHVKNERLWFTNIYAIVVAGVLSFLHSATSNRLLELSLIVFLFLLSFMGLLISFRLKAELEGYLDKLDRMIYQAGLEEFSVHDEALGGKIIRLLKFRWMFTFFYATSCSGALALLIERVIVGT